MNFIEDAFRSIREFQAKASACHTSFSTASVCEKWVGIMYMGKTNNSDRRSTHVETIRESLGGVKHSTRSRSAKKKHADIEVLRDIAQLWVKADQTGQNWMKGFLELLMEYSLGHIESENTAQELQDTMKRILN